MHVNRSLKHNPFQIIIPPPYIHGYLFRSHATSLLISCIRCQLIDAREVLKDRTDLYLLKISDRLTLPIASSPGPSALGGAWGRGYPANYYTRNAALHALANTCSNTV